MALSKCGHFSVILKVFTSVLVDFNWVCRWTGRDYGAAMAESRTEPPESTNEVILSFFDTLLYRRDLDLLKGNHWMNDVLIGFYYE